MTFKTNKQQENSLKDKIVENLIVLTDTFGLSQVEICKTLGYTNDVLSRVKSDDNYRGSPQLLAGLELLKELTILKRTGVNQELARELETMKRRIEDLQKQVSPRYPEHKPDNLALNQDPAPFNSDPAAAARAAAKLAVKGAKKPGDSGK